ncbi:DUF943 family protein [Serratia sp. Tan611]|uniref:DUF943 family protein n=1 Tax=Serratia sp. Tan611 TaxID=2773264 RepID=UPI0019322373|nr:DUF943 family protein [Serratia sp. Tan611]CAE1144298.1 conserved protein of unknown function [Serratia sp. Tan611]
MVKYRIILLLMLCILIIYAYLLGCSRVEIVAVHQRDNYSDVLVKSFPVTDKGKIQWWFENKDKLKNQYNIPQPASYGGFTVTFWLFGDGYQEEGKYDRLCFDDMPTNKSCIDKNLLMMVRYAKSTGLSFRLDGGVYRIKGNGEMIKEKYK